MRHLTQLRLRWWVVFWEIFTAKSEDDPKKNAVAYLQVRKVSILVCLGSPRSAQTRFVGSTGKELSANAPRGRETPYRSPNGRPQFQWSSAAGTRFYDGSRPLEPLPRPPTRPS